MLLVVYRVVHQGQLVQTVHQAQMVLVSLLALLAFQGGLQAHQVQTALLVLLAQTVHQALQV
jgi:hypothetical protein